METSAILQIPFTVEECVYLMRSYIYIDKMNGQVTIREITPFLAPGFILGVCAQIPFLYGFVEQYLNDVGQGTVFEVQPSNQYKFEMERNYSINSILLNFDFTPTDCDSILSVILSTIVHCMYGRPSYRFKDFVSNTVENITEMACIYPMEVFFPRTFLHVMRTALIAVPDLRIRMMAMLCSDRSYSNRASVWAMVKRYICIQIRNYHMGTFMIIGQWYETHQKTLAHADPEIVDEMNRYYEVKEKIKSEAAQQASAYCAIEWKKRNDERWSNHQLDIDRFGVDTKSFERLLDIPVKYTLKRHLNEDEIEMISSRRFKELETEYTAQDDDDDGEQGEEKHQVEDDVKEENP